MRPSVSRFRGCCVDGGDSVPHHGAGPSLARRSRLPAPDKAVPDRLRYGHDPGRGPLTRAPGGFKPARMPMSRIGYFYPFQPCPRHVCFAPRTGHASSKAPCSRCRVVPSRSIIAGKKGARDQAPPDAWPSGQSERAKVWSGEVGKPLCSRELFAQIECESIAIRVFIRMPIRLGLTRDLPN